MRKTNMVGESRVADMLPPSIKVGLIITIATPSFRFRIGELGRCKMEKQLNYGTYEPDGDV